MTIVIVDNIYYITILILIFFSCLKSQKKTRQLVHDVISETCNMSILGILSNAAVGGQ